MNRALKSGILFALIYWGMISLIGIPPFVRPHHLAEYIFMAGLLYGLGVWSGRLGK